MTELKKILEHAEGYIAESESALPIIRALCEIVEMQHETIFYAIDELEKADLASMVRLPLRMQFHLTQQALQRLAGE